MVQNQLVDYISAQMKSGIGRDAIKSALTGVGWQAADIEDSLQKAESNAKPAASPVAAASPVVSPIAQVKPLSAAPASTVNSAPASRSFSPMDIVGSGPRTERLGSVSPIASVASVAPAKPAGSAAAAATPVGGPAVIGTAKSPFTGQPIKISDLMGGAPATGANMAGKFEKMVGSADAPKHSGHMGEHASMIAEGIGLIALAALTIYFYTQNLALSAKVGAVNATGSNASAQLSALQSQVQALTDSNGTLQGQANGLTAQTADLETQLSFFVAGTATSTASGTLSGTIAAPMGAKGLYGLRTQYGAVIYVKNSSDPKAAALLKPLVGTSATLAGSYLAGSDLFTVDTVNSQPVNPPAVASTTSAAATTTGQTIAPPPAPAAAPAATSTASTTGQ
jgi:hypothetical protein